MFAPQMMPYGYMMPMMVPMQAMNGTNFNPQMPVQEPQRQTTVPNADETPEADQNEEPDEDLNPENQEQELEIEDPDPQLQSSDADSLEARLEAARRNIEHLKDDVHQEAEMQRNIDDDANIQEYRESDVR